MDLPQEPRQAMPTVSVLMSVHNGETFLRPALESLLSQTFDDFELVVVDDASTDETPAILAEYQARDDRIRILRNETNRQLPASLNRGLEACRASLVARADADDVYEPERIARQVEFMRSHPEVGLVSSNVRAIDTIGRVLFETHHPVEHAGIRLRMNYRCPINHPATMFRRDLVVEVGGYNPDAVWAEDIELWKRLVRHTRFANVETPLVRYRQHETSETNTRPDAGDQLSLKVRQELLARYLDQQVSLAETDALHALLRRRSTRHPQAVVERGIRMAKKLRDEVYRRSPSLRREFEGELFDAICSQSTKHSAVDRRFGLRLMRRAVEVSPRQLGRASGLKKIAAMVVG